jgi:NTP pyrophosphatase (non-canonical NTP hydrolase)
MTLHQAQTDIDTWIKTTGVKYFSELTNLGILVRKYGDQSFKPDEKNADLADELADVLWVLLAIANQTGVDLTDALEKNFQKKTGRDQQRHRENPKLK